MDEFLAETPAPETTAAEEDPFGMGAPVESSFEPPEPLAPPAGGDDPFGMPADSGAMDSFAPPADVDGGMDTFGAAEPLAMPAAEPLPTFGEEPAVMPEPVAPAGGLGDEFAAPTSLGPLAKWRIEQQEKVAAKAAAAEEALAQRVQEAQEAIAQFYAERTELASKRATANREEEAAYIEQRDAAMIADSWESVWKLIDVKSDKEETATTKDVSKDTSRMKQVLLKLKHT